ncbi:hypothetical protein C8R44DRAFT_796971 [Mycena epipterygia]|nr:hypothetical protein C8R44DRAFT_796971 [Mycena epipterygia]
MVLDADYEYRAGPALIIWDQWQPACDACGRLESSLKKRQLLSCAGCLLSKYCSKECQKKDWNAGHKSRCHLFEADRKLSTVFAKSLGPGTINDPTLSLADKLIQWNFLNVHNHFLIACAALKNDAELATKVNVGIFLKIISDRAGSKYDNRTFIIDRIALFPRESSEKFVAGKSWKNGNSTISPTYDHSKMLVGYCILPNGEMSETQMWTIPAKPHLVDTILPPDFDLHRYITHVNRGVTHFHASFWPLPRDISDSDLEIARAPDTYCAYSSDHHSILSGLKGQEVIGILNADGTRTSLYKRGQNGYVRKCAPGETDTEGPAEHKKHLVNPSRMVKKLAVDLGRLSLAQDQAFAMTEATFPLNQFDELLRYIYTHPDGL